MKYFESVLSNEDIIELNEYEMITDERTDARPDVVSKHPRWDVDEWPQHIIKKCLDRCIDYEYEVEEVIFNRSKISFRLHADSGTTERARRGHAVLIPLYTDGPSHTIFFDNFWDGDSTKFSKEVILPYEYRLPNKNGEWQYVPDIRNLYGLCLESPDSITDFDVTEEFMKDLENLIEARSNQKLSKVDGRTYDYSKVENYDPTKEFDSALHEQYLSHIDLETLHGLTLETAAEWIPGDCICFSRRQLHAAGSGHSEKVGVTVFVQPVEQNNANSDSFFDSGMLLV